MFTRSASTWTQQGPKLAPSTKRRSQVGSEVALSADGDIALVGAIGGEVSPPGQIYVYRRTGTAWSLVEPLSVKEGHAGFFFALSGDANTAVVAIQEGASGSGKFSTWAFTKAP